MIDAHSGAAGIAGWLNNYFSLKGDVYKRQVEGSITMGAAIAAKALTGGVNPYLAIILAFFGGMLAGLFTGCLLYTSKNTLLLILEKCVLLYFYPK